MSTALTFPSLSILAKAILSGGAAPALLTSQVYHEPTIALVAGNSGTTPVGQVDRCISQPFSVASGTPVTINVATALDPLGNAAGMARVVMVLVENDETTTSHVLTVGGGTHPVLGSDQMTVQPNGGVGLLLNPNPGYVVSGGSADTITLTSAAGTVTGKITILGASV